MNEIIKIILAAVAAVIVLMVTFYVVGLSQNISHDSVPIKPGIFMEGSLFRIFPPLQGSAIIDTKTETIIYQKFDFELDPGLVAGADEAQVIVVGQKVAKLVFPLVLD